MAEDHGDQLWWLFTDVVGAAAVSRTHDKPWPQSRAKSSTSGPVLKTLELAGLVSHFGLRSEGNLAPLSEGEADGLVQALYALGLSADPRRFQNVVSATVEYFGRETGFWRPDSALRQKLWRDEVTKRWIASVNGSEIWIPQEGTPHFWLMRIPWYRATWLGAVLTQAADGQGIVATKDETEELETCQVPEFVSQFLGQVGPLADLDAALLFAASYLWTDEVVRSALHSICPGPSRWAAGRLLAERARYGLVRGVEFRWLEPIEAREALRAAAERVHESWGEPTVGMLERTLGVGLAEFDASKLRPTRDPHPWETSALVDRAAHILGVAPTAPANEIKQRVAAVMPQASAPPLSQVGELMEAVASAERDRAQLAAAVLLANLHTKNS